MAVTLALPSLAPLQEMLPVIWLVAESKLGSDKVTEAVVVQLFESVIVTLQIPTPRLLALAWTLPLHQR